MKNKWIEFEESIEKKISLIVNENKDNFSKGKISKYQNNCLILRGIDLVMQKYKKVF